VCNARRALVLVDGGKAEVLEHAEVPIERRIVCVPAASVIRLVYMISGRDPRVRADAAEIFIRDHHACQYAGSAHGSHPGPRVCAPCGGRHTWTTW